MLHFIAPKRSPFRVKAAEAWTRGYGVAWCACLLPSLLRY